MRSGKNNWPIVLVLACPIFLAGSLCGAGQQNHVSQFGITWTFDKDYNIGRFANGDYWVVGPVTVTRIDPPSVEIAGGVINGSMVNSSPELGRKQAYRTGIYGRYTTEGDYVPGLNVARPNGRDLSESNALVLQPGSSLISTISTPQTGGTTPLKTAAILTVLGYPAPEGSFRPPYAGTDKTIRFDKSQLDYSVLARLQHVPGTPGLTTVERYFERPWLDHIPSWLGRSHHPADNMPSYDREVCTQLGIGALMLNLDFENHYKETLLIRYTQIGIDLYGVIQAGGQENWTLDSGRKFPILFAGLVLNDPSMKSIGEKSGDYAYTAPYGPGNPPKDLILFEEDETTFYVTQEHVDLTHSPRWSPDTRDAMRIPYEREDIGLPEWGKGLLYDRTPVNKYWKTTYRRVIGHAYGGFILAVHVMGVKDLWNHDALFDYKDRYMQVESESRETSRFAENMWDAYRADYGPVWTMSPVLNVNATGGSVTINPDEQRYALGETVILRAVPDAGYEFVGWSGDLCGTENPTRIIMHANRAITASFAVSSKPLELGSIGNRSSGER